MNELKWDLKKEMLSITALHSAIEKISAGGHSNITISNVTIGDLMLLVTALDLYHSIGSRLEAIEKNLVLGSGYSKTYEHK